MTLSKPSFYLFLISVLSLMLNSVNAASVYKWVDEDGQVHYGSKPKSKSAKEVKIKKRYIDSGTSTPSLTTQERVNKQKKFINALDEENKILSEEKRKKKKQEELKNARCNAARDQLKRQESASALYDLDEKGNRILLDKKQYEIAMKQARARVAKWCD
ncbi:MAG: DUF4124 domain-containing protein [Gammaproteobacteria bacterium]|nr:DUF4124 domain-containing protein [Gammaproteobacteria bacterium]